MNRLYERGAATLVASWEAYAAGAPGAVVHRLPGVAVAVFPTEPERSVFNNALLVGGLPARDRDRALDLLEDAYAGAGVAQYAVWVHDADGAALAALLRRGHRVDTATRVMAMELDDVTARADRAVIAGADWGAYRALLDRMDVPTGLLAGLAPDVFDVVIASEGGEDAAAGIGYDHDGDCGLYNVVTLPHARRRGLGTAVTAALLQRAAQRGCRTASLQATPMAQRLYAALGFRDLGRFVEYIAPEPDVVRPRQAR